MDNLFKKLQEFFQNLFSGFNSGGSGGGGIGDFFKKLFGGGSTAQTAGTGGPSVQPGVQPTASPNSGTTQPAGTSVKVEPSQPRPVDAPAPAAAATVTAQTQDATKPLPKTLEEAVPDKDGVRTFKAEGSDAATVVLPDSRPAEQPQTAAAATASTSNSTDSILEQNRKAREAEQARNPQANLIGAQGVGTAAGPEVDKRNWLEKMRDRGQPRQDYYTEATMNPNNPYSPTNQVRSAIGGQVMGKMREMGDRGGWRGVVGDMGGAMVDGIGRSSQYREQTEYMRRNTAARSGYPTRDDGVIMCGGDVNARVANVGGQFGASCGANEDRIIAARERGAQRLDEQTTNNVITAGSRAVVDMLPQSGNAGGWFGKIIGR